MHTQSAISVADFAASRRQIAFIHRGGRAPSRHSDSRALQARQSCRFLETDLLFPPLAALRRFPLCAKSFLPEGELPRSGQEKPLWRARMSRQKTDFTAFTSADVKLCEAFSTQHICRRARRQIYCCFVLTQKAACRFSIIFSVLQSAPASV